METRRLKRMIIIILTVADLLLLLLLAERSITERRRMRTEFSELSVLYADNGIALDFDTLSDMELPELATVQRNAEAEEKFIVALLGKNLKQEELGSVIAYTSEEGNRAHLRQNGAVELEFSALHLSVEETEKILKEYGYSVYANDGGSYSATQTVKGLPLLNATLHLQFENGLLRSANGYYVNSINESDIMKEYPVVDALTRFLRYAMQKGLVFSKVISIKPAWLFSSATLFQSELTPVFLIKTDTTSYYVNLLTQEISETDF